MNTRFVIASLASLAFAGTAAADDDSTTTAGGGDAGGDGTGAPAADPAAPADPAAAPAPAEEAPAASSRWPRDIVSRVLTLPKGLAQVGLDLATPTSSFFDPAVLRVLVGYGITDDFELNFAGYSFPTSDVGKGSIDFGLGYKLARGAAGGKLEAIARVQTGYSLATEGLNPLALGVHVQYNITPKIAVITPGGQLVAALDGDPKPISLVLPVALGVQLTPTLYAQVDTTLATIKIKDSANAFIFADSTPITAALYLNAMPALDVYAGISLNVTPPDPLGVGDTAAVLAGVRYYIGKL